MFGIVNDIIKLPMGAAVSVSAGIIQIEMRQRLHGRCRSVDESTVPYCIFPFFCHLFRNSHIHTFYSMRMIQMILEDPSVLPSVVGYVKGKNWGQSI